VINLERHIVKEVDPTTYYAQEIGYTGDGQKIACPFHTETKPSFEIRPSDGSAYCYGCRTFVKNIVMFDMLYHKRTKKQSLFQIFDLYIEPLVHSLRYVKLEKNLKPGTASWKFLRKRGITPEIIQKFHLGYNHDRISIPIFNEWGYCVNIRFYDYTHKEENKVVSYKKGYGKTRLYPMISLAARDVYIFEGESDTLLALSHGLDAITTTGGAESWKDRFARYFRGKNVVICMDNDEAGRKGARLVAEDLRKVCNSLKVVSLPTKYGKDFTDYLQHKSIEDFKKLILAASNYQINKRLASEDVYATEKGMILTMDKDKETIHLIIKVEGRHERG